ncbi:MAG: hypothetical protein ACKVOX_14235 [Rhizobacter sp.]
MKAGEVEIGKAATINKLSLTVTNVPGIRALQVLGDVHRCCAREFEEAPL